MKSENLTGDEAKRNLLAILNGKEMILKPSDPEWRAEYYNGKRRILDSVWT